MADTTGSITTATTATAKKTTTQGLRRNMLEDPNHFIIATTATATATATITTTSVQSLFTMYLYYLDHYSLLTQAVTAAFFAGLGDVLAQSISSQQKQIQQRRLQDDDNVVVAVPEDSATTTTNIVHEATTVIIPVPDDDHDVPRYHPPIPSTSASSSSSYDVHRTMHYVIKGLGGGCMWSVWFSYSDPISFDITQRLLETLYRIIGLSTHTELGYAIVYGNIDVATATSYVLSTILPFCSVTGCALQHMVHVAVCILLEQFFVSPLFYTVWDIPIPALLSGSPIRQIPAQIQAKLVPLLIANAKVWTPANVITYSLPSEYRVLFASVTDVIWQTILSDITSNEIVLQPPPMPTPVSSLISLSQPTTISQPDRDVVVENGSGPISNGNNARSESILTTTATTATPNTVTLPFFESSPLPASSTSAMVSTIATTSATTSTVVYQSNSAPES
jgi:hypothetical protein